MRAQNNVPRFLVLITWLVNSVLIDLFLLSCLGAGNGDVSVVIVDTEGKKDTVKLILENKGDSVFRCTYRPMLEGPHTIHILFAGQEILKSPFRVQIKEGKLALSQLSLTVTNCHYTNHCCWHYCCIVSF